ncbi:MAG: T9SS type A sorting domain-containing protein [Williamsia sp.]|nr:T9SS type A sorting domain-containing protein [Williamsia sp.]
MKKFYTFQSVANYQKTLTRLQKSIRSGRFKSFTQQKKQQIWNRLCRYARQLGVKINTSVAAACLAAGLSFAAAPASAQTFTEQTGTSNPFNGIDNGDYSIPTFVDIDGDGDQDAFIGDYDGTVKYYKNTGTATAPVFTLQGGAANPLNSVSAYNAVPTFVDIDGDGDKDAFIGEYYGTVLYYKNTGTATAPVFTAQTGAANPLNSVSVDVFASPSFVDIDGDGDQDAFIGDFYGTLSYYKNTGTSAAPVFALQTDAANPFNGLPIGYTPVTSFVDIDADGDKDAFIGDGLGTISYYKNTGTSTAPVFAVQTGAANPFDGVSVSLFAAPAFVDIDGDGDFDAFIGEYYGTISYYKNTSAILPLHLLSFSGSRGDGYNELTWQTASEENTKQFDIEQSKDGRSFTTIATVKADGNGSNQYSSRDYAQYSGKVFYRLKMVDADNRFTYSSVIFIDSKATGVSIYPNPATSVVHINIRNAALLNTGAGIYDANGRLLKTVLITTSQQTITVQSLAKGVYTLRFANGTVQRFIKQ